MGNKDGEQWTDSDGTVHTVNPTDNPKVPEGGYYHTQKNKDGKASAVYNPDGTLADVRANRDWKDVPRQD